MLIITSDAPFLPTRSISTYAAKCTARALTKELTLYRVSANDLARRIETSAVDISEEGKANVASDFYFSLDSNNEPFGDVRRGMMIPYFGKELPVGCAWADGKTKWPDEPWVPVHLRGNTIPDMDGELVGGTSQLASVGAVFDGGKVVIPGFTIDGKSFSTPANEAVDPGGENCMLSIHTGLARSLVNGKAPDLYHVETQDKGQSRGYTLQDVKQIKAAQGGKPLQGAATISENTVKLESKKSNPRHYMARWIIRIK